MQLDRDLMEAVRRGEQAALGALYDRYGGVLFTLCVRILRDPADAEEALGDVFWELWRRPERYDARRGGLLAYLVTLTRSRAIDRLRSRKSREKHQDALPSHESGPLVGAGPSPLDEAVFGERRSMIERALSELTPEQRRAIELSFFEGRSHGEISAELQEPLGTVKSRIRGGLIRLRDSLRTPYGGQSQP